MPKNLFIELKHRSRYLFIFHYGSNVSKL